MSSGTKRALARVSDGICVRPLCSGCLWCPPGHVVHLSQADAANRVATGFVTQTNLHLSKTYQEPQHIIERAMTLESRITHNPNQCGGRPCIRGMRIRVTDVLDLLAAGLAREQVIEELPDLEPEDIEAALRFASRRLDHAVLAV